MAKPQVSETTVLQEVIAIRLQQLEEENGGVEAVREMTGLAKSTYHELKAARGNPSLVTIANIAANLKMSFFELLGLSDADARRSLKKLGIEYDELVAAVAARNKAERRLAELRPGRRKASASQ